MRILVGLLWALAGAVAGFVAGALVALVILKATNSANREGAHGYAMFGAGFIGAIIGLIIGLLVYGRSAPAGQGTAFAGSGFLGVVGLIAVVALGLWAFMNLREAPLMYDGSMASLELELRVRSAELPAGDLHDWLEVEVQTAKTRPVATLSWSSKRIDGEYTIVPATQNPLYRSASRVIVVQINGRQAEAFMPRMRRTPDPKADWSEWFRPQSVDPPYGVVPPAPLRSIVELRYRVRRYGDQ
jgi:MFS family permease